MTRDGGTVTKCAEGPGATRTVTVTYETPPSPVIFSTEGEPPCPITERQYDHFLAAMGGGGVVKITTDEAGGIQTLTVHKP